MDANLKQELESFIRLKAPGLTLTVQENPAFNSVTLGLGLKIDLKNLLPEAEMHNPRAIGSRIASMLAEVQKATVTAIGLEEYIRERELAVLDRIQERLDHPEDWNGKDPISQGREELGG